MRLDDSRWVWSNLPGLGSAGRGGAGECDGEKGEEEAAGRVEEVGRGLGVIMGMLMEGGEAGVAKVVVVVVVVVASVAAAASASLVVIAIIAAPVATTRAEMPARDEVIEKEEDVDDEEEAVVTELTANEEEGVAGAERVEAAMEEKAECGTC